MTIMDLKEIAKQAEEAKKLPSNQSGRFEVPDDWAEKLFKKLKQMAHDYKKEKNKTPMD